MAISRVSQQERGKMIQQMLRNKTFLFQFSSYERDFTPKSMYPKRESQPGNENIYVTHEPLLGASPSYETAVEIEKDDILK
jgi:hypothetical protein